jgi:hypothetical protein
VLTGGPWIKGDRAATARIREWFATILDVAGDRPFVRPRAPAATPRPRRPPSFERTALWFGCWNVNDDAEVAAWLAGRGIDPNSIAALDLVRALPPNGPLPDWCQFKGTSWRMSGHRLIAPALEPDPDRPGGLQLASLHARCVRACAPSDKAASPAGFDGTGLVLAEDWEDPMRAGRGRRLVTLCEGVTDFLALALQPSSMRGALLGTWSGSARPELAALVPPGWVAALAHDGDAGGDQQAAAWRRPLEARGVRCERCPVDDDDDGPERRPVGGGQP